MSDGDVSNRSSSKDVSTQLQGRTQQDRLQGAVDVSIVPRDDKLHVSAGEQGFPGTVDECISCVADVGSDERAVNLHVSSWKGK